MSASPSRTASNSSRCSVARASLLLVAAAGLEPVPAVAVGLDPEPVEDVDQQGVVRGAVDGGVEPVVALQLGERRRGAQRLEPVERRADVVEVGVGAALRGEGRGERVEAAPQLQQVAGLRGVQRSHPRVAVGVEFDQALLLEPPQRLAQGSGADADLLGEEACGRTAPGASAPDRISSRTRV